MSHFYRTGRERDEKIESVEEISPARGAMEGNAGASVLVPSEMDHEKAVS